MLIKVLRAKIHRAVVTDADVDYVGSITIDMDLADAVGIVPGECVLVADIDNGQRMETYVMAGDRGSGTICLNGAAARLVETGHKVIVMAFGYVEADAAAGVQPRIVICDGENRIRQRL
jgi:aspartate 1-decarboxylase